jgi:NAD(P)-dependent dehydrogenase (short-subunit alcohol dehydrogenase family)
MRAFQIGEVQVKTESNVILITGGTSGIGAATSRLFAQKGHSVIVVGVQDADGQNLREGIRSEGGFCQFFKCDVSSEQQVADTMAHIAQDSSHIDVLVNNAGIVLVKPLDETSWEEYQQLVNTNLGGTFLFTKHVLPIMKKQRSGAIVNVASISGHVGQIDHVLYGATKGAILALTRALSWEVAPYKIRVNSISPGAVDTPMLRGDLEIESKRTGLPFDQVKREREAELAFKRWADPSEIAEAIYFLGSNSASFITGTDLLVDCGWAAK